MTSFPLSIAWAAFALPLVACKGAATTMEDKPATNLFPSSTPAATRKSSSVRSFDNHEQANGRIALQGRMEPALKFRAQMQNDTLSGDSPKRPTSRAAVPVVSPQERPRVKQTLQLAEAFQEAAQRQPQGEICTFAQKAPIKDAWDNQFKVVECDEALGMSLQSAGPDETLGTSDDIKWEGTWSNVKF